MRGQKVVPEANRQQEWGWNELLLQYSSDPSWLLYHIDLAADSAQLVRVDAAAYQRSLFLDSRLSANGAEHVTVRLSQLVHGITAQRVEPLRWVFHVGQCGSTLLSRLLDSAYSTLPLREPLPLRSLAAAWRELRSPLALVSPEQFDALSDLIRFSCARRFAAGGNPVVKASSDVSVLCNPMLGAHTEDRAVFLVSRLETYLTQMLRDVGRRHEAARFAQSRLRDLQALPAFSGLRLHDMVDAERIAMCWLSVAHTLLQSASSLGERAMLVSSEDLRESPEQSVNEVGHHLGLDPTGADPSASMERVLRENAKVQGQPYDPEAWASEAKRARAQFALEIDQGLGFARRLLDRGTRSIPCAEQVRAFI